jgi:transcriptional regulator with XRE-family HTH domain
MPRPFNTSQPLGQIMQRKNWTAMEVSRATGIHPRTLTDYLAGTKPIQPHHLWNLADILGCTIADLLG